MTVPEFVSKWKSAKLTERAAAQSHFIDLCDVIGESHPTDADRTGESYTFEKGVSKIGGGEGWADVWMRGNFAWEYKGKHKDLKAAYLQLLQYREDLENPPLLVVCDLERFEIHTNFTAAAKKIYEFSLDDLLHNMPTQACDRPPLDVLRALFQDPGQLKPGTTTEQVTEDAAKRLGTLAESLRLRGVPPERAAHFLMRLLFCLFAEDIGLLPAKLFSRLVDANRTRPAEFTRRLRQLFSAMAEGGSFGVDDIEHFDGGLFMDDEAYDLSSTDLDVLADAAKLNWASIEPAIFGTLFERSLDPSKRSQLGAHYTSRGDIELIVEPVLMAPLRREWIAVQAKARLIAEKAKAARARSPEKTKYQRQFRELLMGFSERLASIRVLDPACGSGNFLYVSLKRLLDLEREVSLFALANEISGLLPRTDPTQLFGIETNVYAHELASVVVWIGYIQWQHDTGVIIGSRPVLKPLSNIQRMDAVLAHDAKGIPVEPKWPDADVIVGNPPFLGDKKMRAELGDEYVDELRGLYEGRVPGGADLVTFWFERARAQIENGVTKRAGLLATNSITMVGNRRVLESIKASGDIFMAWSDRPWILDGASVRVAMVGFDNRCETARVLDGRPVQKINSDLTAGTDVTSAVALAENENLCFLGVMKGGPFDIDAQQARKMLDAPQNPNGRSNSDVVKRRVGGQDITGRPRDTWIVDFGQRSQQEAALYELPYKHVLEVVKPIRDNVRDKLMRENWWLHGRSRPALRLALNGKSRCIVTPEVSKHRLFAWIPTDYVSDHKLHVVARDDDYFFGVLHSRAHEVWSLAQCSWIGVGNDPSYNSTRTFETFPFPWAPGQEPCADPRVQRIAAAARELVEKRDAWLNPPRASADELKRRTLTNLYNARPEWLANLHSVLDAAVFEAYGWPATLTDAGILERLLALNCKHAMENKSAAAASKA